MDVDFFYNRVSLKMADCFDVDSTMTVMVTKIAGKPNGENRKVRSCVVLLLQMDIARLPECTGLFISPSGISELDCATTKTHTAERSISIGRESLQVFFFLY